MLSSCTLTLSFMILVISVLSIIESSLHNELITSESDLEPSRQQIASKLFEAAFSRNLALVENVLLLFINLLTDCQIAHAIYLVLLKANTDSLGNSDNATIDLLSVFVRNLKISKRFVACILKRCFWEESYLWTDQMMDVLFLDFKQIGQPLTLEYSLLYQKVINKAIKWHEMLLVNYFRKRGFLSNVSADICTRLLRHCRDTEVLLFVLRQRFNVSSPLTIRYLASNITSFEFLDMLRELIPHEALSPQLYPNIIKSCDDKVFEFAVKSGSIAGCPKTFEYYVICNQNISEDSFNNFCDHYNDDVKTYLQNMNWHLSLSNIPPNRLSRLFEDYDMRLIPSFMESFLGVAQKHLRRIGSTKVSMFLLQELKFPVGALRDTLICVTRMKEKTHVLQERLQMLASSVQRGILLQIFDGTCEDPLLDAFRYRRFDLVQVLLDFLKHLRDSRSLNDVQIHASPYGIEMLPESLFRQFSSIYAIKYPANWKIMRNAHLSTLSVLQSLLGTSRIKPLKGENLYYIAVYVLPMAIRCRFDCWLVESLRFLHYCMEDCVRLWFNSRGKFFYYDDNHAFVISDPSMDLFAYDSMPDRYNNDNPLPLQKFDIFLDFFVVNLLERIERSSRYKGPSLSSFILYEELDHDHELLFITSYVETIIRSEYVELVPELIQGVRRIQRLLIHKIRPYESTMKILDQVSLEFFMQVIRNPSFFSNH